MNSFRRSLIAATAAAAVGAAVFAPTATAEDRVPGFEAVGLSNGTLLVGFDTEAPDKAFEIGQISGLDKDEFLVGIDYRVQDGGLYGVGDQGGIYLIDDETAEAEKVRQLTVALDGEFFGVDFNPPANALRVISDSGQNLRQPFAAPDAETAVDTDLTNPPPAGSTDRPAAEGVSATAYTNNDLADPTATTQFVLDTDADRVSIQSPPNNGLLTPTGSLPADIGPDSGLDIRSTLRDGVTVANDAFATVVVDGQSRLWNVDLLTGGAIDKGAFPGDVTDLALTLDS